MISYKKTNIVLGVLGVLWEDRQIQRVDRRVLPVDKRVLLLVDKRVLRVSKRVLWLSKRVLQVGQEYYEWLASNSVTYWMIPWIFEAR